MFDRETLLENCLWEARAELENRAADLERQAKRLRAKARELIAVLDPPKES